MYMSAEECVELTRVAIAYYVANGKESFLRDYRVNAEHRNIQKTKLSLRKKENNSVWLVREHVQR